MVQLSRHIFREIGLASKILHIGIEAANQAWVNALFFMTSLSELVLDSSGPSSLGAKVFRSFIAQPGPGTYKQPGWNIYSQREDCTVVPFTERFGLKYRRWLQPSDNFSLIPDLVSIIKSKEHSIHALQRFSIWMTSSQEDPVELIRGSRMSRKGLERLAKASGIQRGQLLELGLVWVAFEPSVESLFPTVAPQPLGQVGPHNMRVLRREAGISAGDS